VLERAVRRAASINSINPNLDLGNAPTAASSLTKKLNKGEYVSILGTIEVNQISINF